MNENIKKLINENKIKILGASKTKTIDDIYNLYNEGITIFGENYVQELKEKYTPNLPFEFHYIGKLQTNKIKDIVPRVTLIHSVSRIKELKEINKECLKLNKNMNILIELHLTNEETKNGVLIDELENSMRQLSGCWEGPAWGAYQKTVAEHMEILTDIYNYMGQYTITMQEAAKEYVHVEQDVCADIRSLNTLF